MKEFVNSFFDLKTKISSSLLSTISRHSKTIQKPRKILVKKTLAHTLDVAGDSTVPKTGDSTSTVHTDGGDKNLEFLLQRIKVLENKVELLSSPVSQSISGKSDFLHYDSTNSDAKSDSKGDIISDSKGDIISDSKGDIISDSKGYIISDSKGDAIDRRGKKDKVMNLLLKELKNHKKFLKEKR
jgi:hypothetical protein